MLRECANVFSSFRAGYTEFPFSVADPIAKEQRILGEQSIHGDTEDLEHDRVGISSETIRFNFLDGIDELHPLLSIVDVAGDCIVLLLDVYIVATERIDLAHHTHLGGVGAWQDVKDIGSDVSRSG